MAICITHGVKALHLDGRRVLDGPVPMLVEIIECRLCAAENEDDGVRQLETVDKGPAARRYVKAPRFPCPVRHGKRPERSRPKRRHYRGRTGGETSIPPRPSES